MTRLHVKRIPVVCLLLVCVPSVVTGAGQGPGRGLSAGLSGAWEGSASRRDLSIATPLLSVNLDYDLRAEEGDAGGGLAQRITGTLHSDTLAWLGVDARLSSDVRVRPEGARFRHRLDSVLTRPLADVAMLKARYRLELDKDRADLPPVRRQSILLRAEGEVGAGRLQWDGSFRETHSMAEASAAGRERNVIELRSRYRVAPGILLDLTSRSLREWQSRATTRDERRYGAGLQWEPPGDYRLAVSVDRLEEPAAGREELIASGSLRWAPAPAWNLVLRYSEQLQRRGAGIVLEANIDIGGG